MLKRKNDDHRIYFFKTCVPSLMQAISELGYTEPTPIQEGMIPLMLTVWT